MTGYCKQVCVCEGIFPSDLHTPGIVPTLKQQIAQLTEKLAKANARADMYQQNALRYMWLRQEHHSEGRSFHVRRPSNDVVENLDIAIDQELAKHPVQLLVQTLAPTQDQGPGTVMFSQTDVEHLLWLAARDVVMFHTWNGCTWDDGWYSAVVCNDTFCFASADAESLSPGEPLAVRRLYEKYGWAGVTAWCAKKRNAEPLKQLQNENYMAAMAELNTSLAGLS